jgi:hypothetical protein
MADLDATAQKLLNKDPNNPNSPNKGEAPRPGLGLSRSTMTASKPSLRETMLAQKKATLSAKNKLPPRPGSAMANMSPVRKVSDPSQPSVATSKPSGTRVRPEAGTLSVNASGIGGTNETDEEAAGNNHSPRYGWPVLGARPAVVHGSGQPWDTEVEAGAIPEG